MLPIGMVSAGFLLISLDPIREAARAYGATAVSTTNFEYAGEAATIAGWLVMATAAFVSLNRLSPVMVRPSRILLLGAASVSIGLAIAAGLNLTGSVVIIQHRALSIRGIFSQSYVSLVRSLERSSDGAGVAAWLTAMVAAATSLIRVRRAAERARALFTAPLFVAVIAAAAQAAAGAITFVFDWAPSQFSIGWIDAILGLQVAAWFFFSVALYRVVVSAHREHDRRWLVALTVGAFGPFLLASSTMLMIAFYEQWVGTSSDTVLSHWEDCLLASGWIVLAAGAVLFALAVGRAPRPARVRSEHETRWWIREVLSNRPSSQLGSD